uniref:Uncharacterized protein n=1 Tax=Arundo donax TaxID=35708 RepID=A0A0A8XZT1_ARUDO
MCPRSLVFSSLVGRRGEERRGESPFIKKKRRKGGTRYPY